MWRRSSLLLLVATMLEILGAAQPARAQDEVKSEPEEAQPAESDDMMSDEQFEQWIFGRVFPEARKHLESRLAWEINRADQMYRLTPAQKKKLEIAGRGSMKRLFDSFESAKEQLHRARGDYSKIGPVLQELQSFQQAPHAYLFGDDSILAKTLKRTLTPAQIADRAKTVYGARVEWMVSLLDGALALKPDQHRRFVSLIVEQTPPLNRYGSFDYDAVMLHASRLPPDKIKPIFDDAQLSKLLVRFEQARRMETVLVGEGYVLAKPKAGADRSQHELFLGAGRESRD
jgi:hypothetical protein